ncbi:hypothetical protein [Streptomyces sp. 891-h]|uniref:hypothetical protein n=1 Tax=Streptomyces sp. 891-h TaxID=2720714 RepID=UPI001FA9C6FF|nr:hypothetical protein [Streptomyces sp. 891-h]
MSAYRGCLRHPSPQEVGVLLEKLMYRIGLRGTHLQLASMGSVGLCIVFWMRAAGVDQDERGNAERRALFVGLWAPQLWLMGQGLGGYEQTRRCRPGIKRLREAGERRLGRGGTRSRPGSTHAA